MPFNTQQKLMGLGVPTPMAKELAAQIDSASYNWNRLVFIGFPIPLARYLAISLQVGTFSAKAAVELSMTPAVASLIAVVGVSVARNTAKRVIASRDRGITPITQVMSPVPSYSVTANDISTLRPGLSSFTAASPTLTDTTLFTPLGVQYTLAAGEFLGYGMTDNVSAPSNRRITAGGMRVVIPANATAVEFAIHATNTVHVVYVTDVATRVRQRASTNDVTGSATQFGAWYKYDFGSTSSAGRVVEILSRGSPMAHITLRNIVCATGISIAPAVTDPVEIRMAFAGDSHANHTVSGAVNPVCLVYPNYAGERLGTANIWAAAADGTGFLNPSVSPTKGTYRQRLLVGDLSASFGGVFDVVVLPCSTNDGTALNGAFTDAALAAEIVSTLQVALAAQPTALIFVPGPFNMTVSPTTPTQTVLQSRYDAIKAAVLSVNDPRAIYLDNSPAGTPYITAGNVGVRVGADGTHLTTAGSSAIGYILGDLIISACTALAA